MEEVEMMVESLLDVLLQTLLTIMSKSHAQEAVRGSGARSAQRRSLLVTNIQVFLLSFLTWGSFTPTLISPSHYLHFSFPSCMVVSMLPFFLLKLNSISTLKALGSYSQKST